MNLQSLNLRLTVAIYAMAIMLFILMFVVFSIFYLGATEQRQIITLRRVQDFVNHPDHDKAVAAMPEDLATGFTGIREQLALNAAYFATIHRWGWSILVMIVVALSPLVIVFSLFVSRRLTLPLKTLAASTRQLAKGDFSVRAQPRRKFWDNYSLALAHDFNMMAASLEKLNDERQNMIADIAHELRTPLTSMQLQLEALQDGIDPLTPATIDVLYQETTLLSHLIQDLRTLSLAEARQLSLHVERVEVFNLVEQTLAVFQTQADEQGIDLVAEGDTDIVIDADAARLRQVLNNLLSNALRYTPQGGRVSVKLTSKGNFVEMTVSDTGTGLSENDFNRIFDRFYRSDKGRVRSEGSSGLGLAIVKALVELHGGSISASNRAEGGAVFTTLLPS